MNGLLLVNLGTPDEPETKAVRRYLRQFLSDPYVVDINPVGRWLLLNLIILPLRPAKSAAAYREVWTERGSPLLFHTQDLTHNVQERLGGDWKVELGMRYGNPSIEAGLKALVAAGVDRIIAIPLFPQYALSSTETAVVEVKDAARRLGIEAPVSVVGAFYDDPGFIDAFAAVGSAAMAEEAPDYVLFSFHGVPERHVRKTDPTGAHCLASDKCCDTIVEANKNCYRAQCIHTARALAAKLGLAEGTWSTAFQSRLGRTPWIRPYTDEVIVDLANKGIKKVAVFCPAFVADCLETIEEIGMRAKEDFGEAGGESLRLVPSLNSSERWADAVADMARRAAG